MSCDCVLQSPLQTIVAVFSTGRYAKAGTEKIIENNLPSVEEALSDLKAAWKESQIAEENFKKILNQFIL